MPCPPPLPGARSSLAAGGIDRVGRVGIGLTGFSIILGWPFVLSPVVPKVLGEAYSIHDEEDMAVKEVTAISISQGR